MNNDISKISVNEAFNNPNGKTSSNKLVSVVTSFVCLFLFVILVIYYFINPSEAANVLALIDKTTVYFSVAAGIMGVKTIASNFGGNKITIGVQETNNEMPVTESNNVSEKQNKKHKKKSYYNEEEEDESIINND